MTGSGSLATLLQGLLGQGNTIPLPMTLVKALGGDYAAAALCSQVVYWQGKTGREWVYKSYPDWEDEIVLSKHKVRRAAQALEAVGVMETRVRRAEGAPTVHYRVDRQRLAAFLLAFLNPVPDDGSPESEKSGDGKAKNRRSKGEKPEVHRRESGDPEQETTQETTTVDSQPLPAGAGVPAGAGEGVELEGGAAPPPPPARGRPRDAANDGDDGPATNGDPVPAARDAVHKDLAERVRTTWNDHRGPLPACRSLNDKRIERTKQHAREFGADAFLDLFETAVKRVASSTFWRDNRFGIDTLLGESSYRASKVLKHAEAHAAKAPSDARLNERTTNWGEGL